MPAATMIEAINEGLEAVAAPPETPAPPEAEKEEEAEAGEAAAAAAGEGEGDTGGDEKPPQTEEEKAAAETAAAAAEAAKPPKALDPINDPIPTTVSERTRERITSLVNMVKERDAQVAQGQELFTAITSTGANADEVAAMLGYMRAIHSPNIEDRRQAYSMLMAEIKALAPLVGEVLPGQDPLEGHQDLIDAVAANSISQQHAEELAKARARETARTTNVQQLTAAEQSAQQAETARLQGVADLNALEATLKSDPLYAQKYAILVPTLKPIFATLPPAQWKAAFQQAYNNLTVAPVAPVTPKPPVQQPMRANKQPSGATAKQPTTMLEAISAGLSGSR